METFTRMLADKEASYIQSNLAFCQILTGDVAAGLTNATKAVAGEYEPLFELNKGIGEFLQGSIGAAKQSLNNALQRLREPGGKFDASAVSYVLVLELGGGKLSPHAELP